MTLQETITHFTSLARERGEELLCSIQLEFQGATLSVFWEGGGGEGLPREANLYFGNINGEADVFSFAYVVEPHLYMWAVDQGLDDTQAQSFAVRMVESVEAVEEYFAGRVYPFVTSTVPADTGDAAD